MMKKWIRVVPLVAALAASTAPVLAQAPVIPPEVAAIQASLAAACVATPAGTVADATGCLAAVQAAINAAALLPVELQGAIGILIGDIMELFPELTDAITQMVTAAGLPALTAGVSIGLSQPGPTVPAPFSPV